MADFKARKAYYEILQDYIQSGSKDTLSDDEEAYLGVLTLLNSLRRKYGKENAVSFIQRQPYNIPYHKARAMYDEAINLFYIDDNIEKQAYRNAIFQDMMNSAEVVRRTAKNADDMKIYGDLVMKAYKMKGLDTPEPPKVPEGMYKKPIKIYALDPGAISLKAADRNALAERIDNLEIAEIEKNRIRQEAGVDKVNFLELLDEQEEKIESGT